MLFKVARNLFEIHYIIAVSLVISVFSTFCLSESFNNSDSSMTDVKEFNKDLEVFGKRLFDELSKTHRQENIVFSPFSIQTCLAMARMGAVGSTALEMDKALGVSSQNIEDTAKHYHGILAKYNNSSILKVANKIYIMGGYQVKQDFNNLLTTQFFSSIDAVDFAKSDEAARTINNWVEDRTNKSIKNLMSPDALNVDTRLVLVNAIYFDGKWVKTFPVQRTSDKDFYLDETTTVKVEMMYNTNDFLYGYFPELNATALEMPYKDSDLSMLVILPNSRTGLTELEEKLKNISLNDLIQRMYFTKVLVKMPKFRAEFAVCLSDALKNLGMSRIFSNEADFSNMLSANEPLKVSAVVHKAFINVNEMGTEAAAATVQINMFDEASSTITCIFVKLFQKFLFFAFFIFISLLVEPVAADEEEYECFIIRWFNHAFNFLKKFYKWLFCIVEKPKTEIIKCTTIATTTTKDVTTSSEIPTTKQLSANDTTKSTTTATTTTKDVTTSSEIPTTKQLPASDTTKSTTMATTTTSSEKATTSVPSTKEQPYCSLGSPSQHTSLGYDRQLFFSIEHLAHMLLQRHIKSSTDNMLVSPFSIETGLISILINYENKTAKQIEKSLKIDSISNILTELYTKILTSYKDNFMANKIYFKNDLKYKIDLSLILNLKLKQEAEPINLKKFDPNTINSWVENKTDHSIKNFITEESNFDNDDCLVVINGMTFKKNWKQQFKSSATTKEKFHIRDDEDDYVHMMKMTGEFKHGLIKELEAEVLEMPFEDNYNALIILPKDMSNLEFLLKELLEYRISNLYRCMETKNVTVNFPKFELQTSPHDVDLIVALKFLGMRKIFSKSAQYKTEIFEKDQEVYLTKFLHKAVIQFTESGTTSDESIVPH